MPDMIYWFEIPVRDLERAVRFYSTIFGMDVPILDLGNLKMGLLGDRATGVAGALVQHDRYEPSESGALLYFDAGDDLHSILSRVENAGGTIIIPKRQVSEAFGFMAVILDTEGNRIALHSRN